MLIDTHAHLNFNIYKNDYDEIIRRSLENNTWMINVGTQYNTSKKAIEIARRYKSGVYAAIGLHPIHLETGLVKIKNDTEEIEVNTKEEDFDYEKYKGLAQSKKVVAIGEMGLDYYYRPKTKKKLEEFKNKQKEVFLQHLDLVKELNLPIIFHCRMAHDDLIKILNTRYKIQDTKPRGVVHCFTGTWEQAGQYLEMGLYLGFNGIIFKLNLDEIIKRTPLERILVETDCPYLTPPPMVGRNEPFYVRYVAERIAKVKNLSFEEIAKITTENAKRLFKI
ncbi:hydrolase TatD [bacterium (Candidatus Moisslbacteria) CG02_land_8_20_14_3_00_36_53]|nr:MAG: hydrolase TatD [bacterium (Candidatus Moisslbacteria) CG02_land_8_20_14_3_00_36_53]